MIISEMDPLGAPKRVLSLLGQRRYGAVRLAWIDAGLEVQVHKSILTTMHGRGASLAAGARSAAFLRSLPPPPALASLAGHARSMAPWKGAETIFRDQGCVHCHTPPAYHRPRLMMSAIHDESATALQSAVPAWRDVRGGPYFHDSRASTLEDVITKYRHQL